MKILFVAPWVPTTRRPRSLQFLNMMAQENEVHVVVAAWSAAEAVEAACLPGASVTVVRLSRVSAIFRVLIAILSRGSLQQAFVSARSLRATIAESDARLLPDLVFCNVLRGAQLVRCVAPERRTMLDMDEFRSDYYRQAAQGSQSWLRRLVSRVEVGRMVRAEDRALREFDLCLVSSPSDLKNAGVALVRSAQLVERSPEPKEGTAKSGLSLIFAGRMSYAANVEGITSFVRSVWPDLRTAVPDITLRIVGDSPSKAVRSLEQDGIEIVGRVPDIAAAYYASDIVIVPIRMATGVQMKLIEGLAAERPTIVTPRVAELAGVENGIECSVADSPSEWVEAVLKIIEDRNFANLMAKRGYAWAISNHGVTAVKERFDQALHGVLKAT